MPSAFSSKRRIQSAKLTFARRVRHLLQTLRKTSNRIFFQGPESRFIFHRALLDISRCRRTLLIGKPTPTFSARACHWQCPLEDEHRLLRTGEPIIGISKRNTWPERQNPWASTRRSQWARRGAVICSRRFAHITAKNWLLAAQRRARLALAQRKTPPRPPRRRAHPGQH